VQLGDGVAYFDTQRQHLALLAETRRAIESVLSGGEASGVEATEAFEAVLARRHAVAHVLSVSSGTDALTLALMALGLPPQSDVIVPSYGFFSTPAGVIRAGLRPVFVDVDPATLNLDCRLFERAVTGSTRAVIPVHLYGRMIEMNDVINVSIEHSLQIVEDAAQAIGARSDGCLAGTNGAAGILSFNRTKQLGSFGNGGAILTNDGELAQRIVRLRNYGASSFMFHTDIGLNSRLDPLEASILSVKERHLDEWTNRRRQIAALYWERLQHCPGIVVEEPQTERHVYQKFAIRVLNSRDSLQQWLSDRRVETMVFYPRALHQQPCFLQCMKSGELWVSERAAEMMLCLPMYPELFDDEVHRVCDCIEAWATR
jgi:dTDP-4-amino-4,6-dideoxygalactose transaminase